MTGMPAIIGAPVGRAAVHGRRRLRFEMADPAWSHGPRQSINAGILAWIFSSGKDVLSFLRRMAVLMSPSCDKRRSRFASIRVI